VDAVKLGVDAFHAATSPLLGRRTLSSSDGHAHADDDRARASYGTFAARRRFAIGAFRDRLVRVREENFPMRSISTMAPVVSLMGIAACGAGDGTGYGGTGYVAPAPSPTAPSGGATLTVKNFLGWCSVAVNGGAASTGDAIAVSVAPGTVATIVASPASDAFQIGAEPWFGVDQAAGGAASGTDIGTGPTETSTAAVTLSARGAPRCVSVCCQEPGDAPDPCPITDPCL
jgi:hypothetical protein